MNRIRNLRNEKGWKQSELGKLLNVQDAAISKYESEKIPLTDDTLIKLSDIFNVSIDYILCVSDNKNISNNINLTDDESKLLNIYKCLSNSNKDKIIERAETLFELDEGNTENKEVV